jgi:transcriptional regulator with XRE-family HTH domain
LGVLFCVHRRIILEIKPVSTIVQLKSIDKYSVAERLLNLRLRKQLTWEQLADLLGMAVSMLYHVKRGNRNLSEKALFRLEQAEIAAGLRRPAPQETSTSKHENSDLQIGLKRLHAKLNPLNPQAQKRILKAVLQILDEAQRKALSK